MISDLVSLIILFFVIIDPLQTFAFFFARTHALNKNERLYIAILATSLAAIILYLFLFFGKGVLDLFNTNIDSFRIAGGILLALLGISMSGFLKNNEEDSKTNAKDTTTAIATVIATPLLCGPAAITATIISVVDYGKLLTAIAIGVVLLIAFGLLLLSVYIQKTISKAKVFIQVLTTILGLITLAWGIDFILIGLHISI